MADSRDDPTRSERPSRPDEVQETRIDASVPAPEAAPASVVDDRYEIGTEIARGGMGRVVDALDRKLGRVVALKEALTLDPEAVRRFHRETRITARLEHPAIVPVHDAGIGAGGAPYYVMRKVGGRRLDDVVRETTTIDQRLAILPFVLAAIDAVAHAHGRGVVHRDLKPPNILVGELGETVVIDWGLAKIVDEPDDDGPIAPLAGAGDSLRTQLGLMIGTPGFMAPEQLRGDPVTPACDVYALGATLYYVLAGRPPHHAKTGDAMVERAMAGPAAPLVSVSPATPRELATIVDRALAYDERVRYRDAAALGAELRRFTTGQLVAAHRYSLGERVRKLVRRHRAPLAVGAVALVLIGAISTLAIRNVIEERDHATRAQAEATEARQLAEAARAREADRADELLLAKAAVVVPTDPVTAIGLLHQLPADSARWKTARDILFEARLRGVPWIYPLATRGTFAVDDAGANAYLFDKAGSLVSVDLAAHTHRTLGNVVGDDLALLDGGRSLVTAGSAPSLTFVEPGTGRTEEVPLASPATSLHAVGDLVAWIDRGVEDVSRSTWVMRRGARPIAIATSHALAVAIAPDRRHVAIAGQPMLVVNIEAAPRVVLSLPELHHLVQWSSDGRLATVFQVSTPMRSTLRIVALTGIPSIREHRYDDSTNQLLFVADQLYYSGTRGLFRVGERVDRITTSPGLFLHGTQFANGGALVGGDALWLARRGGYHVAVKSPIKVTACAGAAEGTRVLLRNHEQLAVYDVPRILPRWITSSDHAAVNFEVLVEGHHLSDHGTFVESVELATGKRHRFPGVAPVADALEVERSSAYVIARARLEEVWYVLPRDGSRLPIRDARYAYPHSPTHLHVVTETALIAQDVATRERRTLWTAPEPIAWVGKAGRFLVITTKSRLYRFVDGAPDPTSVALPRPTDIWHVALDGVVNVVLDAEVWRWPLAGPFERFLTLAKPIDWLTAVPTLGVAGNDEDGWWLVRSKDGPREPIIPPDQRGVQFAQLAPIAIPDRTDRVIRIYELEGRHHFELQRTWSSVAFDGRLVVFRGQDHDLLAFDLDLPRDRASYQRELASATNLRINAAGVVWPR